MQITDERQYQDALTEIQRIDAGEPSGHDLQRRRELEAATAFYAETLRGKEHRPGRPDAV